MAQWWLRLQGDLNNIWVVPTLFCFEAPDKWFADYKTSSHLHGSEKMMTGFFLLPWTVPLSKKRKKRTRRMWCDVMCMCVLRCLCVLWYIRATEEGRGRRTGQIPTHNLNLIGPGLTGWGQNEEKISHINQDKIISWLISVLIMVPALLFFVLF